jgi:hypothetical protein
MNTSKTTALIPKVVALILVSLFIAWRMHSYGSAQLAKLDSVSPAEYLTHKRHLYQISYTAIFIMLSLLGALYLSVIEGISYVIKLFMSKAPAA